MKNNLRQVGYLQRLLLFSLFSITIAVLRTHSSIIDHICYIIFVFEHAVKTL